MNKSFVEFFITFESRLLENFLQGTALYKSFKKLLGIFFLFMVLNRGYLFGMNNEVAFFKNGNSKGIEQQERGRAKISTEPVVSSSGTGFFADFLFWIASESGTDNWAQNLATERFAPQGHIDIFPVDFYFRPGLRIGITHDLKYDLWDMQFYYTYYQTVGTDHVSGTQVTSSFLGNFYINNANGVSLSGPKYHKASIEWTILYNIFDWDLGRKFWVSKALSMRPFIALRGGWINQKIHTKWQDPILGNTAPLFSLGIENLKNDFWGIGPGGGVNSKWTLGHIRQHAFSLMGDFSFALMYGHWSFFDKYKNNTPAKLRYKISPVNGLATMFKTLLGLRWDVKFDRDRYQFACELGYEMQFWLDQLQFNSFNTGRLNNELTLEGGTLDFRFDF